MMGWCRAGSDNKEATRWCASIFDIVPRGKHDEARAGMWPGFPEGTACIPASALNPRVFLSSFRVRCQENAESLYSNLWLPDE
jgi:hypothetical protein